MKVHPIASRIRAPRRGFTLAELLIAIIILLFGVVAALRIFPPGFAAFNEAQNETVAQSLSENGLNELINDAGSLPDAIWPVEPSAVTAIVSQLRFDDLRAVDFVGGPWDAWGVAHRYTFGADGWPEWQPLSARILRRVIGEKVGIPSSVNAFTDDVIPSPSAFNLSRLPSYIPRFAPIEADTADALLVYDTRYQSVAPGAVGSENAAAGKLYYNVAYDTVTGNATFTFKKVDGMTGRFVRLVMAGLDAAGKFTQVAPAVWNVADPAATAPVQGAQLVNGQAITATVTDTGATYTFVLDPPDNCKLVPGSEQLNRAYEYVNTDSLTETQRLTTLEGLAARQFSLYTLANPSPQYEGITKTLLSMLIFSKKDSGRTVKLDYIVADWGILRDDVTVGADGYAALTAPPRLNARASYPREAEPWGLLEPMTGGQLNVVMTLVDLFSSNVFSVECDPDAKNKAFSPLEQGYRTNALLTSGEFTEKLIIDVADAQQKRFRLGVQDNSTTPASVDWHALAGQTFRVYYRAQRDWTVQFFRAPAEFRQVTNTDYLGWTNYTQYYNNIFVPGIYAGQSVAVDYLHRDVGRVTQSDFAWIQGNQWQWEPQSSPWVKVTSLSLSSVGKLEDGDEVEVYKVLQDTPPSPPDAAVLPSTIVHVDRKNRRIVLNGIIASEDPGYAYFVLLKVPAGQTIDDVMPLQRVNGEIHTITAESVTDGISRFSLQHLPAVGTYSTIRGASVAVRTLWTQPRSGEAYVVDNDSAYSFPEKIRTIGERWRGKTAVINLPVSGD